MRTYDAANKIERLTKPIGLALTGGPQTSPARLSLEKTGALRCRSKGRTHTGEV